MKLARIVFLGVAPLAVLSCASIAPVKISAGDQCFRCRRTITDARMAAETVQGGFVSKYRTSGCMAKYIAAHAAEGGTIFVTDLTTGRMIAPEKAFFVRTLVDRDRGEMDYRAYAVKADADAAAAESGTVPVSWQLVLDEAR